MSELEEHEDDVLDEIKKELMDMGKRIDILKMPSKSKISHENLCSTLEYRQKIKMINYNMKVYKQIIRYEKLRDQLVKHFEDTKKEVFKSGKGTGGLLALHRQTVFDLEYCESALDESKIKLQDFPMGFDVTII